jgi:hypothetical protein
MVKDLHLAIPRENRLVSQMEMARHLGILRGMVMHWVTPTEMVKHLDSRLEKPKDFR